VLAIIGIAILFLTYTIKEVWMDNIKNEADSVRSAEALYRIELGQSVLWLQNLTLIQADRFKEIKQIVSTPLEQNRDYSDVIRHDLVVGSQALGDLNSSAGSISRFLDALPPGADDLREQLGQLRPNIEKVNRDVAQTLKPSPENNWKRAVDVKLALISVGLTEIPVAFLGDSVLTRADQVKGAAEKLYRIAQRASYFLYVLGLVLGLLGGVKAFGGTE
jgi:hypothetical protein